MKRLVPCFLVMLTLTMYSCQKELGPLTNETEIAPPVTPPVDTVKPVTGNDLLVRMQRDFSYSTGNKESRVAEFSWNAAKRLVRYSESGTDANESEVSVRYRFDRDAGGKVVKAVQSGFPASAGIDSIVYTVVYQAGTEKLAYVNDIQYSKAIRLKDSIVYTYDASNHITQKETWFAVGLNGTLNRNTRQVYTYDTNGNITKLVEAAYNSTDKIYVQSGTFNYTYGTFKTPVQLGVEAFIVSKLTDWVSPYYTTASVQRTETGTFTYDYKTAIYTTSNKPVEVTITQSGGGVGNGTLTCTYN